MRDFFLRIAPYVKEPFSVLLMSGEDTDCSRYCIAGWDPLLVVSSKGNKAQVWDARKNSIQFFTPSSALHFIDSTIAQISCHVPYKEPPFVGGFMGYISYEFKNVIEPHLPQSAEDDLGLPDFFFIFPSTVVVFDKKKLS
jgi:para-aminobenzoate synthetase component 1